MKNKFNLVLILSSLCSSLYLTSIDSLDIVLLPAPYNQLTNLLPFNGHGWYSNGDCIEKLMKNNNIQTVVEIGSWLGCSTRHIASLLPKDGKLYAVDTWAGSAEHQNEKYADLLPTLYDQFLSNVVHAGLTHSIVPLKMSSQEAVEVLKPYGDHFDLIYIDAEHDTESVLKDLEMYFPFIADHHGILCGDDWWWESVQAAVLSFAQKHNLTVYANYNTHNFWFLKDEGSFQLKSFVNGSEDVWKFPQKKSKQSSNLLHQLSMVEHVAQSVRNADLGISQLTADVLRLEGMSSNKVRHLLNNLCSFKNSKYLEIGVWKGSTFVSAMYKNNIKNAVAIDNWALFSGPKDIFQANLAHFLQGYSYTFYEHDCFTFDVSNITEKFNIYFYDGDHKEEDQRLAFTYFNDILEDTFIAIVDDYNWKEVQDGTQKAFKELGYNVLFQIFLPSEYNGDVASWWNGIYVAVVSKH